MSSFHLYPFSLSTIVNYNFTLKGLKAYNTTIQISYNENYDSVAIEKTTVNKHHYFTI
jgi:hypothetical protein